GPLCLRGRIVLVEVLTIKLGAEGCRCIRTGAVFGVAPGIIVVAIRVTGQHISGAVLVLIVWPVDDVVKQSGGVKPYSEFLVFRARLGRDDQSSISGTGSIKSS